MVELTWFPRGLNGKLAKLKNTLTQLVFRFPCLYDSDVVKLEFSQSGGLSKDTLFNRPYVPTDWCTYS